MNSKNKSYLFAILTVCMWGTTFALSKFVVPNPLSTITFTAIRTTLGFLTIIIFLAVTKSLGKWWDTFRKNWKYLTFLGICLYSFSYIIQYLGIQYTDAMNQAIISNTIPFWVVVWNFLLFRTNPDKRFIPASIVAFTGVFLIEFDGSLGFFGENLLGDLISLCAFALWGAYNVAVRKILKDNNPTLITASFLFTATLFMIPFSYFTDGIGELMHLDAIQWLVIFYLGFAAIGLAFILWNTAMSNQEIPSENISLIVMLNPVVGIITSMLLLDEQMTLPKLIGCACVFSAIFIVNYRRKTKVIDYSIKLSFHELSCYSIDTVDENGKPLCIVFDPHDGKSLELPAPTVKNADIVLCSHSHYDHNIGKNLVAASDALILDEEPGRFEHRGIKIYGTKVRHGKYEEWGDNVVYSVKLMNEMIIIHGGDMGFVPTKEELENIQLLGKCDVAILPIGATFCLDAEAAIKTSELLSPKITTVATHYLYGPLLTKEDFQGMTTEQPFVELVGDELEVINQKAVFLPKQLKKYVLFAPLIATEN